LQHREQIDDASANQMEERAAGHHRREQLRYYLVLEHWAEVVEDLIVVGGAGRFRQEPAVVVKDVFLQLEGKLFVVDV
jgi:hypothetical protein